MSEPHTGTGKTEIRPCRICTTPIEYREYQGMYEGKTMWMATGSKHKAPCGAHCFGGGGRTENGLDDYKAGNMHGLTNKPCPNCGHIQPKEA